jgi:hypothetical protein
MKGGNNIVLFFFSLSLFPFTDLFPPTPSTYRSLFLSFLISLFFNLSQNLCIRCYLLFSFTWIGFGGEIGFLIWSLVDQHPWVSCQSFFTELGLDGLSFAFVVHTNWYIWVEPCLVIGQFELLPKRS